MITREWHCNPCALDFEAVEPICPNCKQEDVKRIFLTAPAIHTSGSRQFIDGQLKSLAAEMGMTDISNHHTGTVAGDAKRRQAHVVGGEVAPVHIQSLIDNKMNQMVQGYKPPVNTRPSAEPTQVKPVVIPDGPKSFGRLRPGPGSLVHPDDRK